MPSQPYFTLHAFTAPSAPSDDFAIFGKILPTPEMGLPWLAVAIFLFLAIAIFYRRFPPLALKVLLSIGVLVTYLGVFILSTRWLDDVFINLIHPYNLFHHHLFSTRMDSMNNGTVEILYYALLTPFAGNRFELVRANYAAGALLGIGHLIALYYLLRRMPLLPRFFALTVFAAWVPLIQAFSSGYGNGVVTLLWMIGLVSVLQDNRRPLSVVCALMPLFRPDALLYSISLAGMYAIVHRRFALRWWIPTILSPILYALMVHQLYHQWVPTPVVFKRVSIVQVLSGFPVVFPYMVSHYFLASLERSLLIGLGALYFVFPMRQEYGIPRRFLGALLLGTLPILLFFYTAGFFGYNPTNYRYYTIFDMALWLTGIMGLLSLLYRLRDYLRQKAPSSGTPGSSYPFAAFLPALFLMLVYANISSSVALVKDGDWEGTDIGIASTFYDLKRMGDLRFGGEYFGRIVPAGWEIAATEMDTFGYFSGREILDLWGFSNLRIAQSSDMTQSFVRRDTHLFMESNVPIFWVRTISKNDSTYRTLHDRLESNDPVAFAEGLFNYPNLSPSKEQAGPLGITLQKYDVVRVLHGTDKISILLVRKDLAGEFRDAMVRGGATPAGTVRFPPAP